MAADIESMAALSDRINRAERELHTVTHRVKVLEDHNMPTRLTHLEAVVDEVRRDIQETRTAAKETHTVATSTQSAVSELRTQLSTAVWVLGVVYAVIQAISSAWPYVMKALQ